MSDLVDLIEVLQRKHLIWHGRNSQPAPGVISSGYAVFDENLSGGFPETGVIRIETPVGIGELRFLTTMLLQRMGSLSELSRKSRLLVFINPPGFLCAEFFYHQGFDLKNIVVIYPRHKNEALWAAEQCLKSGACGSVLLWQDAFEISHIKRLQVASTEGNCLQFIMSSRAKKGISLPVSVNMQFSPHPQGLEIAINKRKGGWAVPAFTLDMSAYWPVFSSASSGIQQNNVIPFPAPKHGLSS